MRFRRAQVAFTAGELDPKLKGRRDTQIFYLGCDHLRNSLVRQQGSTFVRPGTRQLFVLQSEPADSEGPFVRLLPFVFSNDQRYIVALTSQFARVYRVSDNSLISSFGMPYIFSELAAVDFIQVGDTMLLAHENWPLHQIQRRQSDGTFSAAIYSFEFPPQFRIQDPTLTLTPGATTGTTTMTAPGGAPIFRPGFDVIGGAAQKSDIGGKWTWKGVPFTIDSIADNGESAGITVNGTFPDTNASEVWTEQAAQGIWGYHRSLAYFQDRLWIGGARSLPVGLWASRTSSPFDFLITTTDADEPFQFNVGDGRIEPIMYLQPGPTGLEVYTAGNEGLIPGSTVEPITPGTVRYVSQSSYGIRQVKPVRLGPNTIFVDRSGIVRELTFSDEEQNIQAIPLAIRSSHLVPNVVRMCAAPGGFGLPIDFLLFVNANGTGAALTFEKSQDVLAWSEILNQRQILDMIAVGDRVYLAVKQGNLVWLQQFELGCRFDGQSTFDFVTAATALTGLTHLANSTAEAFADGYWIGQVAVNGSGAATLPVAARHIDIGLPIDWLVQPMPVESESRSLLGRAIRPYTAEVRFATTAGLRVNGRPVFDRPFDDVISTPPQTTSDVRRTRLDGWSRGASAPIQLTREGPFPAEILAFAVDYAIGGG